MKTVDVHQAKVQLSQLVAEAIAGHEVVIARNGQPLVMLVPVAEAIPPRRLGTAAGQVRISRDFDEPLPDFDCDQC